MDLEAIGLMSPMKALLSSQPNQLSLMVTGQLPQHPLQLRTGQAFKSVDVHVPVVAIFIRQDKLF